MNSRSNWWSLDWSGAERYWRCYQRINVQNISLYTC